MYTDTYILCTEEFHIFHVQTHQLLIQPN